MPKPPQMKTAAVAEALNAPETLVKQLRAIVAADESPSRRSISAETKAALKALGFTQDLDWRHVFLNRDRGLLVKLSYMADPDQIPLRAIPTMLLREPRGRWSDQWVLQAIADRVVQHDEKLSRKYESLAWDFRERVFGRDQAPRNVGVWRDRLVAFDW